MKRVVLAIFAALLILGTMPVSAFACSIPEDPGVTLC